jgi:hypothetical protein
MRRAGSLSQSLTEFAILLVVVTTAIVMMRFYVQRSLQARYRAGVESVFLSTGGNITQYEPYYTEQLQLNVAEQGVIVRGYPNSTVNTTTSRSGAKTLGSGVGGD